MDPLEETLEISESVHEDFFVYHYRGLLHRRHGPAMVATDGAHRYPYYLYGNEATPLRNGEHKIRTNLMLSPHIRKAIVVPPFPKKYTITSGILYEPEAYRRTIYVTMKKESENEKKEKEGANEQQD